MNNKKNKLGLVKSINAEKKTLTANVSTYSWDRIGERIAKGAWDLTNFKKNPVVLWAHNSWQPPVAKALSISEEDTGLVSEMLFDEQSDEAMKIFSMYQRGFLSSFSVGFIPKKFIMEPIEGTQEKGLVWTETELLEFSCVPIPANPGALIDKAMGDVVKQILGANSITEVVEGKEYLVNPFSGDMEKFETSKNGQPELSTALKSMVELAQVVKGQKMDEQKAALVLNSLVMIKDMLLEGYNQEKAPMTKRELLQLKDIIDQCVVLIKNRNPAISGLAGKFLKQLDLAIKS